MILSFLHAHLLSCVGFVLVRDGGDSCNGMGDIAIYKNKFYPDLDNHDHNLGKFRTQWAVVPVPVELLSSFLQCTCWHELGLCR